MSATTLSSSLRPLNGRELGRGDLHAVAASFSHLVAAHQPASYSRRDRSNRLPCLALHRNHDGAKHVRFVGKIRQSNGDTGDHGQ